MLLRPLVCTLFFSISLAQASFFSSTKNCLEKILAERLIKEDDEINGQISWTDDGKRIEVVDGIKVVVNRGPRTKYKNLYPEAFNQGNEVFIKVNKLGHHSLVVNNIEFNGRVINELSQARKANRNFHGDDLLIHLKGIGDDKRRELVEIITKCSGKRTFSCINSIEYILAEAGIRSTAKRSLAGFQPDYKSFFTSSFIGNKGEKYSIDIYDYSDRSLKSTIKRIEKMTKIILANSYLTLPGWLKIAFKPSRFLVYHPKYFKRPNLKFDSDEFDFRHLSKSEDLDLRSFENKPLRPLGFTKNLLLHARLAWNWFYSTLHNAWGAFHVVNLMKFSKMKHGLLPRDHPWVTGIDPNSGLKVWSKNVIFSSPPSSTFKKTPETDEAILSRVNHFLSSMTKKSTGPNEIPQGPNRRMPHVVNYLHGQVAYNGGKIIFNDVKDAMFHLSDPEFIKDLYRFSRNEKREFYIVLRERDYDPEEYAFFLGFVRSHLKWYANANGPKKRVLYGGPSPYPVVNVINGNWVDDMYKLKKGDTTSVVRPLIQEKYFNRVYRGNRANWNLAEQALAYFNYWVLKMRGFQGGLVFTSRKEIEPRQAKAYDEIVKRGEEPPDMIQPIESPFKTRPEKN